MEITLNLSASQSLNGMLSEASDHSRRILTTRGHCCARKFTAKVNTKASAFWS